MTSRSVSEIDRYLKIFRRTQDSNQARGESEQKVKRMPFIHRPWPQSFGLRGGSSGLPPACSPQATSVSVWFRPVAPVGCAPCSFCRRSSFHLCGPKIRTCARNDCEHPCCTCFRKSMTLHQEYHPDGLGCTPGSRYVATIRLCGKLPRGILTAHFRLLRAAFAHLLLLLHA